MDRPLPLPNLAMKMAPGMAMKNSGRGVPAKQSRAADPTVYLGTNDLK